MSKKKLLNERTIRRFGGLAGIKPISTTSFLSEMGEMPAYARDDEEEELDVEDDLEIEEPGGEELEIEDEEELDVEEPVGAGADDLVVSLLDKVKEWASEQGVEMDVEGEGDIDHDAELGGEEEPDMDMDMDMDAEEGGLELGDEEDELDMDMGDEEETLEEMINSILSEEDEEGEEDKKGPDWLKKESRRRTSKRRAPANESRRRAKQTKRAKSRGVKVQVLSDEKVIQEVTKRVKNRLARIAKAQKRRS